MSTTSELSRSENKELADLIDGTNQKAVLTRNILVKLRKDLDHPKNVSSSNGTELKIRKNVVDTFTRKFVIVISKYKDAQSEYKHEIKKKIKARILISNPDATEQTIGAVLRSGVPSEDLMKTAILKVHDPILLIFDI